MYLSALDLFTIGLGPSSAQTVGPMRAARRFVHALAADGKLSFTTTLIADLFGSLALGGRDQGSDTAVILGLSGIDPENVDGAEASAAIARIRTEKAIQLEHQHAIRFDEVEHVRLRIDKSLAFHTNGVRFTAYDVRGGTLARTTYFSVGDGVVVDEHEALALGRPAAALKVPYSFANADQLQRHGLSARKRIPDMMRRNELALHGQAALQRGLMERWSVMNASIDRGMNHAGPRPLPGGMAITRRAPMLREALEAKHDAGGTSNRALQWARVFATAVAEENAAGGQVVSAPSNGAAGVVPATLRYYRQFHPDASDQPMLDFLLTATAIAGICKRMDAMPAPAVGCQGEVGVACAMAAGGLAAALGGTNEQIEYAACTAIEQHAGLSCDPELGLVQSPCIERNATAAVKAIHAASIALQTNGSDRLSLDAAVRAMHNSGREMTARAKEASLSGLAINLAEC